MVILCNIVLNYCVFSGNGKVVLWYSLIELFGLWIFRFSLVSLLLLMFRCMVLCGVI